MDNLVTISNFPRFVGPLRSVVFLNNFKPTSTADGVAVLLFILTCLGYITRGRLWDGPDPHYHVYFHRPQTAETTDSNDTTTTRNVAQRLQEGEYDCVIFWGSQSGTAERFAETLAREISTRFGIHALVADVSDYDAPSIANIEDKHTVIFLLSTYGEGDPSDNAAGLWTWITHLRDEKVTLEKMKYIAFGLGNSNYKYYNRVVDVVADALDAAGARALIARQKADDANGGTEEDFQSWKDEVFALFRRMGHEEVAISYQPNMDVVFSDEIGTTPTLRSSMYHSSSTNSNTASLAIRNAHELFATGDRNCVHLELDLADSTIGYKTGDHVGIWPCNPGEEVDRLVSMLDMRARRKIEFAITLQDEATKPKLPSPTNLDTAFIHYLDICGPVSRKVVSDLAQFAPTLDAKATLLELGQNRERYELFTSNNHVTFGRLLHFASCGIPWSTMPLSFVFESLLPLQPRYYSISSSSVISPRRISVTALVVNKALPGDPGTTIHGLASNYLLSASNLPSAMGKSIPTFQTCSPTPQILAHVRKTKFKLPITSSTALVLISAGTGFAPFRAFLEERAKLHTIGKPIGKIILFFGCRNQNEYIYREDIERIQAQLGDKIVVITAFSRSSGEKKAYVQDRVEEHAPEVLDMLQNGASMYICGKADMAREVDKRLEHAAREAKQLSEEDTKAWSDSLKRRGKWKADVWG
ncbi:cytochrome P450 reductase 2 [Phaeosphaeriaceae sp. SRC1lsM3a]|nr:cytochrome P450 reductase 2 [Stagonospora sp. SRC1lsM3a]